MDFRLGDVFQDAKILKAASEAAAGILDEDPGLERQKHACLKKAMGQMLSRNALETTL